MSNTEDKLKTYKAANSSFAKGMNFFAKKKFNKAKKEFQKCLDTFPAHSNASYHLAKISLSNKKTDDALGYIKKAKEIIGDTMFNTPIAW